VRPGSLYCLLLLLFLSCTLCSAAEESRPLPTWDYPFSIKSQQSRSLFSLSDYDTASCTIPFVRAGNLIIVKARVDTTEGNFILDTGAPHLVLNITYFRHYRASVEAEAEQTSITGRGNEVAKTRVSAFSLGRLQYFQGEADLVNLGHIENSKGIKILGLLGMELFTQCELIIDYEKNLLYLHRVSRREASTYKSEHLGEAAGYRTFPIELIKNRIIITTTMEGKKMKFVFDCAAESNVLDSRSPDRVMKNVTITQRVLLTGTSNRKVEALYGNLANVAMGDLQLGTLPVLITNLERTCFSDIGCIEGVLGFDFLGGKKIGFNFVTRKMYVWK
jgi:predicted aspartyl protease